MTAIARKAVQKYYFFMIPTNILDIFFVVIHGSVQAFLYFWEANECRIYMKKYYIGIICCLTTLSIWAQPALSWKEKAEMNYACNQWVEAKLSEMSLKEKIGQLFIHTVAPQNTSSNKKNISDAVKEYKVGGLLFSGGELINQVILTNYAQELADIPLMITFDGEWGLAMRLKNTPSFPKNRVLGGVQNNDLIYEYGKEVARQFNEIGVHVNFAPVADVDNNPLNPVINTRSFGGEPKNVAEKVVAYARGLEDGGVLSVCKHFPGHGDTNVDSHKALPVLNFTRERLDSIELYPFRKAIEAGLNGMMVGHLEVPALSKQTASLSKEMIDFLTEEMGFDGLVFTDALEMKGVSNNMDVCARALMAGNDMLLAPRNLKRELNSVLKAIESGKLSEEQITEKCRKVLTYKYLLGAYEKKTIQVSGLENRLNRPETKQLIDKLEQAAVTVISNDGGILPLEMTLQGTVLLNIGNASEGPVFSNQLQRYLAHQSMQAHPDSLVSHRNRLQKAERVIVAIYTEKYDMYKPMLDAVAAKVPVVYVYLAPFKNYYNKGEEWKKAAAVILGHSSSVNVQGFMAEVLVGKKIADGRLSVEVEGFCKPGGGLTLSRLQDTKKFRPEDYGMDASVLSKIDDIVKEGIEKEAFPGCQIMIMKNGVPLYDKCFGTFTYEKKRPVRNNDLYDVASLTKMTGTLLAVMKLYDEGKFGLTDRISNYVPVLKGTSKERITIEELLLHQSGLPAFWPFYQEAIDDSSYQTTFYKARRDDLHKTQVDRRLWVVDNFKYKREWIADAFSEEFPNQIVEGMYVGSAFSNKMLEMIASDEIALKDRRYRYSCLNFMLLKEMIENITQMPLDVYLEKEFYQPMGLQYTLYRPLRKFEKEQIVPTVKSDYLRKGKTLQGEVHDEIASFMGGVSGNAGLFSTAQDMAKICQLLMDKGMYGGKRYISQNTCDFFMNHTSRISRRALGFDKPDVKNLEKSPCAEETPEEVVGHTGFTGTCAWIDPQNQLVFVFLSNRIYPRVFDHKALTTLNIRPRIQQVMYQALKK